MAKSATIGIRVDEELKDEAGAALEDMGLTMSNAVELFLKYVAENRKLPFNTQTQEREAYENAQLIWRAFVEWRFDLIPTFDSPEAREVAVERMDHDGKTAFQTLSEMVDACADPDKISERRVVENQIYTLQRSADVAKDIIYSALNAPQVFVPALSNMCASDMDAWRLEHLRERSLMHMATELMDLDCDETMEYLDEWIWSTGGVTELSDKDIERLEHAIDDIEALDILEEIGAYEDFEEFVDDDLTRKYQDELKAGRDGDRALLRKLVARSRD